MKVVAEAHLIQEPEQEISALESRLLRPALRETRRAQSHDSWHERSRPNFKQSLSTDQRQIVRPVNDLIASATTLHSAFFCFRR